MAINELKCIEGNIEANKCMGKMRKVKGEGKYVFLLLFNVSLPKKITIGKNIYGVCSACHVVLYVLL